MIRIFLVIIFASLTAVLPAQVLQHRSWQFLDDDWQYLQAAIPQAKAAGMNRIQLSHHIVMDAEELWEKKGHEKRLELVRKSAALAHSHGLKVDMWTHELSGVPRRFREGRKVKLNEELWKWLEDKYEHLFKLVPEIDGLILTFAETDFPIYQDTSVLSDLPPQERFVRMIDIMSRVCKKHDKQLIVRSFIYYPKELDWLNAALQAVAVQVRDRGNVTIMSKCVPHDWQPYFPYNPVLGNVGSLPQVVEIDLGEEFTGQSRILHCEVDYVRRALSHARSKGVVGAVARVERYENHALGTPNEVNINAFCRLLHNPELTAKEIWLDWANQRYGEKAAPYMVSALKRTFDMTNFTLFTLEQWTANHSKVASWKYAYSHITKFRVSLWIPSPHYERRCDILLYPNHDTLRAISSEKELAAVYLEQSRADLEKARPHLNKEDYQDTLRYLNLSGIDIEIFKHHNMCMFATLAYIQAEEKDKTDYKKIAQKHLQGLRNKAARLEQDSDANIWPQHPKRIRSFIKDVEKRLN
jgi:Glycosyl hydrolase family 67 middle domain